MSGGHGDGEVAKEREGEITKRRGEILVEKGEA
jgi:hypothetical protein